MKNSYIFTNKNDWRNFFAKVPPNLYADIEKFTYRKRANRADRGRKGARG